MPENTATNVANAPSLRMPRQVIPIDRTGYRAVGSFHGVGVCASGLGGFIEDVLSGDWGGIASDIFDWVVQ
jgi:hypothetical protein